MQALLETKNLQNCKPRKPLKKQIRKQATLLTLKQTHKLANGLTKTREKASQCSNYKTHGKASPFENLKTMNTVSQKIIQKTVKLASQFEHINLTISKPIYEYKTGLVASQR